MPGIPDPPDQKKKRLSIFRTMSRTESVDSDRDSTRVNASGSRTDLMSQPYNQLPVNNNSIANKDIKEKDGKKVKKLQRASTSNVVQEPKKKRFSVSVSFHFRSQLRPRFQVCVCYASCGIRIEVSQLAARYKALWHLIYILTPFRASLAALAPRATQASLASPIYLSNKFIRTLIRSAFHILPNLKATTIPIQTRNDSLPSQPSLIRLKGTRHKVIHPNANNSRAIHPRAILLKAILLKATLLKAIHPRATRSRVCILHRDIHPKYIRSRVMLHRDIHPKDIRKDIRHKDIRLRAILLINTLPRSSLHSSRTTSSLRGSLLP
jgi:hypothetical protein